MAKRYKKNSKKIIIALIVLLVLLLGVLVLSINQYCSGAVGYDKLEQREYTFVKYEITHGRYGGAIEIYVKEEEKPLLGCPNFVRKAVNKNVLDSAKAGDKLIVWVSHSTSTFYSAGIHDGKINEEYFLQLEDYQEYHAKNDIIGIVISSVLFVICLVFCCRA